VDYQQWPFCEPRTFRIGGDPKINKRGPRVSVGVTGGVDVAESSGDAPFKLYGVTRHCSRFIMFVRLRRILSLVQSKESVAAQKLRQDYFQHPIERLLTGKGN